MRVETGAQSVFNKRAFCWETYCLHIEVHINLFTYLAQLSLLHSVMARAINVATLLGVLKAERQLMPTL